MFSKPKLSPVVTTLVGDPGRGKTTLAATWPKPVFIQTEDGMQSIPEDMRPDSSDKLVETTDDLREQLLYLLRQPHDYKTVVIDSVSKLDTIIEECILKKEDRTKVASINQACGGYGAGPKAVGATHAGIRKLCEMIRLQRNMHIVFIAHADTETRNPPDQEAYMRYTLRMGKHSIAPYVDDADIVALLRLRTHIMSDGDDNKPKKAKDTGEIEMVVRAYEAGISKNRFRISEDLLVQPGENPLLDLVPNLKHDFNTALQSAEPVSETEQ